MTMRAWVWASVASVVSCCASAAMAAGNAGEMAPEFPPGVFSDGGQYKVSDFEGKLLVLFFFESECPTCKGQIPQRNAVVDAFKDKPVKFIAVGPHNSLNEAKAYVAETKLEMPVFADNLNIMETLYGQTISLQNIYQFRVIGPKGNVVGYRMTTDDIAKALEQVKWKYKGRDWEPRLNGIVELLEWNQYEKAMNQLRPLRKAQSKSLAESAEKLYQEVRAEGEQWKKDADAASDGKPVEAYDLYLKVSTIFAGDDLAKAASEALKSLKTNKAVTDELAARQMYAQLYTAVPRAKPQQRAQVSQFCATIVSKYPNTPTAEKAKTLAEAIEKAPAQ
jgi:peroxiredoxin